MRIRCRARCASDCDGLCFRTVDPDQCGVETWIEAGVKHQNFSIAPDIHYAGKPLKDRRSDGALVLYKRKLVGFDLIPMRPNLSHQRGTRIFRFSDASQIDITPQQSQKQTESAALPQGREILDGGFNVQANRRPSQLVGSRPLLKITEANFRLLSAAGIQVVPLFRWEREPSSHRDAVTVQFTHQARPISG